MPFLGDDAATAQAESYEARKPDLAVPFWRLTGLANQTINTGATNVLVTFSGGAAEYDGVTYDEAGTITIKRPGLYLVGAIGAYSAPPANTRVTIGIQQADPTVTPGNPYRALTPSTQEQNPGAQNPYPALAHPLFCLEGTQLSLRTQHNHAANQTWLGSAGVASFWGMWVAPLPVT